jgi:hypothetical protein
MICATFTYHVMVPLHLPTPTQTLHTQPTSQFLEATPPHPHTDTSHTTHITVPGGHTSPPRQCRGSPPRE